MPATQPTVAETTKPLTGLDRSREMDLIYGGRVPPFIQAAIDAQIRAERRAELEALEARPALVIAREKLALARRRYVEADDAALQAILLWKQHRESPKAWIYITNPDFPASSDYIHVNALRERACQRVRTRSANRKMVHQAQTALALVRRTSIKSLPVAVAVVLSGQECAA